MEKRQFYETESALKLLLRRPKPLASPLATIPARSSLSLRSTTSTTSISMSATSKNRGSSTGPRLAPPAAHHRRAQCGNRAQSARIRRQRALHGGGHGGDRRDAGRIRRLHARGNRKMGQRHQDRKYQSRVAVLLRGIVVHAVNLARGGG